MSDILNAVLEYKKRLNPENEYKNVFKALQKLNKIEMTVDILRTTKIGKAVNALSKKDGYGDFAKEIVNKWKRMVEHAVDSTYDNQNQENSYETASKSGNEINNDTEYDPSGNWKVKKQKKKQKKEKIKYSDIDADETEYDPKKNWKMEKEEGSNEIEEYVPQKFPGKLSSASDKKKSKESRSHLNNKKKLSYEEKRKAELKAMMDSAKEELRKLEENGEDEEEGDASSNESDPESINPDSPHVAAKSPVSSDNDIDDDTPGAFFLSMGRRSSNNSSSSEPISDHTPYSPTTPGIVPDCKLVSSTTIYSRNKSVDSEEGIWDKSVNHEKSELSPLHEQSPVPEYTPQTTSKKIFKKETKLKEENHKKVKKETKHDKRTKNNNEDVLKEDQIKNGHKRKSNDKMRESEPSKKKLKKEKKKSKTSSSNNKSAPGPSFEDFMTMDVVPKPVKKKKKSTKQSAIMNHNNTTNTSTNKTIQNAKPKFELKLPEIQTNYQPLPRLTEHRHKEPDQSSMTDDMAAELHSQRKYSRRGMFSGGGQNFIPKMIPLFDMCIQVLLQHIDALDVIGVPYEIIEPVLKKCTADQLYHLEDLNPYFTESSGDLWKAHCMHEFPRKEPDEMESWRELYWRLHDERNQKLQFLTKKIVAKEAKRKPLEKKLKLAYVGQTAKAPRGVRRAQEKNGTNLMRIGDEYKTNPRQELVKMRSAVLSNSSIMSNSSHRSASPKKVRSAPLMSKALKEMKRMRFKR